MKGLTYQLCMLPVGAFVEITIMPPLPRNFRAQVYSIGRQHGMRFSCSIIVRQKLATVTRIE